jgi:hypothetical protein
MNNNFLQSTTERGTGMMTWFRMQFDDVLEED